MGRIRTDHSGPTPQGTGYRIAARWFPTIPRDGDSATLSDLPQGRTPAQRSFPPHSGQWRLRGDSRCGEERTERAWRPPGPRAVLTDQVAEARRLLAVEVEAGEGAGPVLVRPQAHGAPKPAKRRREARSYGGRQGTNSAGGPAPPLSQRSAGPRPSPAWAGIPVPPARAVPQLRGFPFPRDTDTP